jgi:hypothetical protein
MEAKMTAEMGWWPWMGNSGHQNMPFADMDPWLCDWPQKSPFLNFKNLPADKA